MTKPLKKNAGVSLTELIVAVGVLGVVGLGGTKLYNNLLSNQKALNIGTTLEQTKQVIRSGLSCKKTREQIDNTTSTCGIKFLNKNGANVLSEINGGMTRGYGNCVDSEGVAQPYAASHYIVDGKLDITVKEVRPSGEIIVWARTNPSWLQLNPDVRPLNIEGDGIFSDAPIICPDRATEPEFYCTASGDGMITFYAWGWDTYSGKAGAKNLFVTRSYEIPKPHKGKRLQLRNSAADHFALDDFNFIVPASMSESAFRTSTRTYEIPDYAYLIIHSAHPGWAFGEVNSNGPTTYKVGGTMDTLPGGWNVTVKSVASRLNMNTVDIHNIELSLLDRPEYINADGNIEFKIFYVPHDGGGIDMDILVPTCASVISP